jgi:ATP-dependent DNA ligase
MLGPVRAIIHDVVAPHVNTFGEKIAIMKRLEESVGKPDILRTAQFKIGKAEFDKLVRETKEQGLEGVIATSLTKPESQNPRIKVKHTKTGNFRIKALTQEYDKNGNPKQSTGAYIVEDANGKEVAAVGMGLSREERIQSWNSPHLYIGKAIQVKFQDKAVNKLRSPCYNGDADGLIDKFEDL